MLLKFMPFTLVFADSIAGIFIAAIFPSSCIVYHIHLLFGKYKSNYMNNYLNFCKTSMIIVASSGRIVILDFFVITTR